MTTFWRDHVPILRPPAPLASTGAARQALHRGLRGWWMALGPRLTWVLWIENISVISTHQPAARTHTPSISTHQPIEIDITECKTLHDPIRSNPKVSFDNCHSVFEAVKMMRRTNKRSLSQFSRCNMGGGFILMRPRSECQNYANHSRKYGHDTSPRVSTSRAAARECSWGLRWTPRINHPDNIIARWILMEHERELGCAKIVFSISDMWSGKPSWFKWSRFW